jgi:hypothetical protein
MLTCILAALILYVIFFHVNFLMLHTVFVMYMGG